MQSRNSSQWQTRRKPSLGKLRRAHPASGATWNVQVVRGKMTSKCLWHACRALALGMVLMLLGAGMATIGYYADQLSVGQEIRGNATIRVRNESRGFHLNNLSYVGPIIMGFGGFIVVAACVMTFEARDSAAKVVPARLKVTTSSRTNVRSNNSSAASTRRANGMMHQSTRWDHHLGVFRTSPADPPSQPPLDRQALTAALIHFSKAMGSSPRQSPKTRRLSRSGSVPNLASTSHRSSVSSTHLSPYRKQLLLGHNISSSTHHQHHSHRNHHGHHLSNSRGLRISSSLVQRTTRESTNSLLHPGMLQFHRHALSVDETGPYLRGTSASPHGSQSSMILADSHEGRLRDRTKRSDTSKKHILARQKPIEKEEPHSPKLGYTTGRRRSSTASDASYASRRIYRRTSSASRTPSIDSRSVQVELHSPERIRSSPRTPRRFNSGQSSTPSVEREFRSQLSICSEPITVRQLSGQSSLEPCVLEESPEFEDKESIHEAIIRTPTSTDNELQPGIHKKKRRPESLILNDSTLDNSKSTNSMELKKILYRSNSSRTFYRPKPKLFNDYDQIYFISTNGTIGTSNSNNNSNNNSNLDNQSEDDFNDSLRVINERRKKILKSSTEQQRIESNISTNQKSIIVENDKSDDAKHNETELIEKSESPVMIKNHCLDPDKRNCMDFENDISLNIISNDEKIDNKLVSIDSENTKSNNIRKSNDNCMSSPTKKIVRHNLDETRITVEVDVEPNTFHDA